MDAALPCSQMLRIYHLRECPKSCATDFTRSIFRSFERGLGGTELAVDVSAARMLASGLT